MSKYTISKNYHYEKFGPAERIDFEIPEIGGSVNVEYGTARDINNESNWLAQVNSVVEEAYKDFDVSGIKDSRTAKDKISEYMAAGGYVYDKDELDRHIKDYGEILKREDSEYDYATCLREINGLLKDFEIFEETPEFVKICCAYAGERLQGTENGSSLENRFSFMEKRKHRGSIPSINNDINNITGVINNGRLSEEYLGKLQSLFAGGKVPSLASVAEMHQAAKSREQKLHQSRNQAGSVLSKSLMAAYTADLVEDALKAKYYDKTKDLSVFADGEKKERIAKASPVDLITGYGSDLLVSHEANIIVFSKIAAEQKNGRDVSPALGALRKVYSSAVTRDSDRYALSNFPENVKKRVFNLVYANRRNFFQHAEECVNIVKSLYGADEEAAKIIAGQRDICKAKEALKERLESRKNALNDGELVSGAVIADNIADVLKEGFEFPTDAQKAKKVVAAAQNKHSLTRAQQDILELKRER